MFKHLKFWKRNSTKAEIAVLDDETRARLLILALKNGQASRAAALLKTL